MQLSLWNSSIFPFAPILLDLRSILSVNELPLKGLQFLFPCDIGLPFPWTYIMFVATEHLLSRLFMFGELTTWRGNSYLLNFEVKA